MCLHSVNGLLLHFSYQQSSAFVTSLMVLLLLSSLQVLADLDVPHYHHELVKDAVELGFEQPDKMDKVAALLAHLSNSGVITTTQMTMVREDKA